MSGLLLRAVGATAFTYGFVLIAPYRRTYRAARRFGIPRGIAAWMWIEHVRQSVVALPEAYRDGRDLP